ncbi:unnamed protein product [Somion occarium]|uniref:Peptidase A1 domain-containing protein n=1 Tax=Somion occarium TaxID=3059160 RepID=A0ABP1DGJ2_9APHY
MNPFLYFLLISLCDMTYGLSIPVKGPSAGSLALTDRKDEPGVRMQKRFSIKENIYNDNEIFYSVNITLGGKEFPVQIDTGASDFWIKPPFDVKFTNVTKVQSVLQFAGGAVLGNISFADMTLGPIRVKSQALVHVIEQRNFDNLFNRSIFGILGLSFPQSSQILHDSEQLFGANSTKGRTFLGNVFAQNKSTPNFFTVLLGRQDDLKGPRDGVFTISEYDSQYGNITSQPKLFHPSNKSKNDNALPLWSVPMDKMFVNGKEFKFNKSSVPGLESGKTAMLLDTGFTLSYIPGAAVDFIYKSISGAKFDKKNQLWEVPCENTTQLDFVFGGKNFSIHPLDITRVKTVGHETVCQSTFRAMQPNPALALDGILGVPFMKNVYAAFDFGDKSSKIAPNVPFYALDKCLFQKSLLRKVSRSSKLPRNRRNQVLWILTVICTLLTCLAHSPTKRHFLEGLEARQPTLPRRLQLNVRLAFPQDSCIVKSSKSFPEPALALPGLLFWPVPLSSSWVYV